MITALLFFVLQAQAADVFVIDDFSSKNSHGYKVQANLSQSLSVETFDITKEQTPELYYQALKKVLETKPLVLNLSLGGAYDPEEARLLREISHQGTYIVVGAGNHGKRLLKEDNIYPCSLNIEKLLCIGALSGRAKTPSSNYGPRVTFFIDGSFKNENATSFAAPKVSSLVAMALKYKEDPEIILKQKTLLIEDKEEWWLDTTDFNNYVYVPKSHKDPF